MHTSPFNPILAVDPGTIIFFIFAVISFFSWIGKQIKTANEKAGQQRARGARIGAGGNPRQQPLQNEIDAFLQDVLGQDPQAGAEQERRRQEQERQRRQQAAAERERERARAQQRQKGQRKQKNPNQKKQQQLSSQQPAALGSELQSHVQTYMTPQLDHLATNVDQHVQSHLGVANQSDTAPGQAPTIAQDLFAMLQSPQGMRQVILLNEIISKPKSQR
ncbi:MAG TPA: hypothetical protein VLA12_17830 [Planctomycetaceae bacterium]|nr:hypothetical protein [Planctomycetaceae bacterium]